MSIDRANPHPGNSLDLLRLTFAALVLLSHAPELIDGNRSRELLSVLTGGVESFGEFAVAGFFALSGYLIMASWVRHPLLDVYFRNRVLRIYPAFVVAFCVSVLIVGPVAADDTTAYFAQFTALRFASAMMTLREPWFAESFAGTHRAGVNGAMWTISYEFACYVAVATIGWCARSHLKPVWLALTGLLLVATWFIPELTPLPQVNRFYPGPLVRMSATFFAGGGGLYLIGFRGFRSVTATMVATALFVSTSFLPRFNVAGFAVFGSMVFLSFGLNTPPPRFTAKMPDISYGTYLYGWPILELLIWARPGYGPWLVFGIALVSSLLCGYLSWIVVEAPFMRLKGRRALA